MKCRQGRDPEQADIVSGRNYRVEAGEEIAGLGSVGDVHALDDEWNVGLGKFLDDFIPLIVRAVEDAEVRPLALRLPLHVADATDDVRTFGILRSKDGREDRRTRERNSRAQGLLFARRLQGCAAIGECSVGLLGKNRGIFVDQCEGRTKDGRRGTAILLQYNQLGPGKVPVEQLECLAGGAAKTVNRLVGIAHGEQISIRAGEARKNLNLGEVRVLKLVGQDEAGMGRASPKRPSSLCSKAWARVIMWLNVPRLSSCSQRSMVETRERSRGSGRGLRPRRADSWTSRRGGSELLCARDVPRIARIAQV